jgi:hypothetical protein
MRLYISFTAAYAMPRDHGRLRHMKAMLAAVNRVLFERWDPIGALAMDPSWPRDEYEGYAAGVLGLVLHNASDDVIAEHLAQIEHQWMGLIPSPLARRVAIAAEIRAAVRAAGDAGPD